MSSSALLERALPFVPGWTEVIQVGPLAVIYGAVVSHWVGRLRCVWDVPVAYTRKIFHFAIIPLAGIVQVVWGLGGTVVFGTVTVLLVLHSLGEGAGYPFYEALARDGDRPRRSLFVLVPMIMTGLGGVLSNLLFGPMATVGYWVCGVGDAVAEPVGRRWGNHRYRVPSMAGVPATRSLEGSAAILLTGWAAAWLALVGMGYPPDGFIAGVALACSLVSTVVEAVSNHGTDNLTLQLAAAGTASWFLV